MYEGYAGEIEFIKGQMLKELNKKEYYQKEMDAADERFSKLESRLSEIEKELAKS
jgi:hypothetical protein